MATNAALSASGSVSVGLPLVIDNGSSLIRAGFAGDEVPLARVPCCLGRTKHPRVMLDGGSCIDSTAAASGSAAPIATLRSSNAMSNSSVLLAQRALDLRALVRISCPMRRAAVSSWEDMELLWSHLYRDLLRVRPEEHPVLLTEAPLNPRSNRERMAQVFFETYNVPAVYFAIPAVLSLYASGCTSGVALDVGDTHAHVIPVYNGFAVTPAVRRLNLGGSDVANHLQTLLLKAGYNFSTSSERDILQNIVQSPHALYVAANPAREEREFMLSATTATILSRYATTPLISQKVPRLQTDAAAPSKLSPAKLPGSSASLHDSETPVDQQAPPAAGHVDYEMPDGSKIVLAAERFKAPEVLFQPMLAGFEASGLPALVADCIQATDVDMRRSFYTSIHLTGGATLFRGFAQRLTSDLRAISRTHNPFCEQRLRVFAPPERRYTAWVGGSILASLGSFRNMWITAQEYREDPNVVHRCMLS